MILVADSGSTKCDWFISDGEQRVFGKTMGFNPFFHSEEFILSELGKSEVLNQYKEAVESVYYYGAGCSSPERNEILKRALSAYFPNAINWTIAQDMAGAAFATCGEDPGVVCILGTGSNSCFYDGKDVHEKIPALGYVLGDEGSGAYFGKILLADYLYGRMPVELSQEFDAKYDVAKEEVFQHVYHKPHVNVYLASFMKFASFHMEHPYVNEMIYQGLKKFAQIHILCYSNYNDYPVRFVGSIAHYFRDILEQVGRELDFEVGGVVKKPIEPLADFHLSKVPS
ncbi:MAG: hypothetical protein JJ975_06070 [Bacteroidia bacterium]|nr:hypothetical protein [Bacteroidia bacterium]